MSDRSEAQCYVRPMIRSDLEQVLTWRNHGDVRRYMFTRDEIPLEAHKAWFERAVGDNRKHLLICETGSQALGFVNLTESGSRGIADWGFYAAPEAPKGSGRQLGRAALRYAFNDLKLHKVCGQVLSYNERSIRLHQFLGFRQEGVLRDQHCEGENFADVVCFGILRDEWQSN